MKGKTKLHLFTWCSKAYKTRTLFRLSEQSEQLEKIEQELAHSSIEHAEHKEAETRDVFKTKKAKNLIKGKFEILLNELSLVVD